MGYACTCAAPAGHYSCKPLRGRVRSLLSHLTLALKKASVAQAADAHAQCVDVDVHLWMCGCAYVNVHADSSIHEIHIHALLHCRHFKATGKMKYREFLTPIPVASATDYAMVRQRVLTSCNCMVACIHTQIPDDVDNLVYSVGWWERTKRVLASTGKLLLTAAERDGASNGKEHMPYQQADHKLS